MDSLRAAAAKLTALFLNLNGDDLAGFTAVDLMNIHAEPSAMPAVHKQLIIDRERSYRTTGSVGNSGDSPRTRHALVEDGALDTKTPKKKPAADQKSNSRRSETD